MAKKVTYVRVPVKREDDLSKSAPKIDKAVVKAKKAVKKATKKVVKKVKKTAKKVKKVVKAYSEEHKPTNRKKSGKIKYPGMGS